MSNSSSPPPAEIVAVGHRGDGVTADGRFVPFALPGERVRLDPQPTERLGDSPERVPPPCRHFGVCGACALQHWADAPQAAWKRRLLIAALARAGVAAEDVEPTATVPPRTRRRASLAARPDGQALRIGFHRRASGDVFDLTECHVLTSALTALVQRLRAELTPLAPKGAELELLDSDTGIDLSVAAPGRDTPQGRAQRAGLAQALGLARLVWNGEVAAQIRSPVVRFDGIAVAAPPAAFVQPAREGEEALRASVAAHLAGAGAVADLFAGLGTFALPLARRAAVHAVEGEAAAAAALQDAARAASVLKPVTAERRDLVRNPLTAAELKRFAAVVLDPPFAGAAAQAAALAASGVPKIAYVTCNPATFARDARTLADGGYRLVRVRPVDQFRWSPHIEAVGLFEKA